MRAGYEPTEVADESTWGARTDGVDKPRTGVVHFASYPIATEVISLLLVVNTLHIPHLLCGGDTTETFVRP